MISLLIIDLIENLVKVKEKLSKEELESLIETLEIMLDEELMESIKRGPDDFIFSHRLNK